MDSLGRNHTLETAVADLIDNSIDAGASNILIRFVQEETRLVCLYVVDDGRGIRPENIDSDMTVGGRRDYHSGDLGHFGVGLKAASFSQATNLTVLSRAADASPVGRRWSVAGQERSHRCDIVEPAFAQGELGRGWPFPVPSGTVIRWDGVRGFPAADDQEQVDEYLVRTISLLRGHLGMTFHRLLDRGLRILIDVEDTTKGLGPQSNVRPLDPFAVPNPPEGWPKVLHTTAGDIAFDLTCHIWPGRSNLSEFRLIGGPEQRQGLYFYRKDRLLQAGGWEGVHAPDKTLQLARVALDIDGDVEGLFTMNSEKSRVAAGPRFAQAIRDARATDGTSIADFIHAAAETWTVSNQRLTRRRHPVRPPGRGFHPRVAREIRDELPLLTHGPVDVLWKSLPDGQFFEVDRDANTLWLNQIYRHALLGGRRGGLNDAPMVKTLLFLLLQDLFQGVQLGAKQKDNQELWQTLLTAAAATENDTYKART